MMNEPGPLVFPMEFIYYCVVQVQSPLNIFFFILSEFFQITECKILIFNRIKSILILDLGVLYFLIVKNVIKTIIKKLKLY